MCVRRPPSQQEALQCVQELNSTQLLFVFVRNGLESTLERSTIARERMGLLLHQLLKASTLPVQQYYKGSVWRPGAAARYIKRACVAHKCANKYANITCTFEINFQFQLIFQTDFT